jgi:type I restriction enzyme R subunit
MRQVQSANYFEQMLGRGTRVISQTDLQAATPDAAHKTHFVIVDAVGVVEHPKVDVGTLDRQRSLALDRLLEAAAFRMVDEELLSSLAARLARLAGQLTDDERDAVAAASGGQSLRELSHGLLDALDPDRLHGRARELAGGAEPTPEQVAAARAELLETAVAPFDNPDLRHLLTAIKARTEQVVDRVTRDRLIGAGYSVEDTERARQMVASFYAFLQENRDEIAALQIIFGQPYGRQRLTYGQVKELAARIEMPPHVWTTEALWRAYTQLERDKVRGVGGRRVLTDLVSLVRHAVQLEDELVPYPDLVQRRYRDWLEMQEACPEQSRRESRRAGGRTFTEEQRWWLDRIAEAIGVNLSVTSDDFQVGELFQRGGWIAARRLFGAGLPALLEELNETLAV